MSSKKEDLSAREYESCVSGAIADLKGNLAQIEGGIDDANTVVVILEDLHEQLVNASADMPRTSQRLRKKIYKALHQQRLWSVGIESKVAPKLRRLI